VTSLELHVPEELLARYATSAPRYTSYPTAIDWRNDLDPATYPERLAAAAAHPAPLSVYIHVPFCEARCFFCGCNVVITKNHEKATPYLAELEKELAAARATGIGRRKVTQYHWGGGTPTYLREHEIERLHAAFAATFTLEPDAEVAIEIDPRHTTASQIRLLAQLGFNRLSLGVQDFDLKVQQAVHRIQSEEETRAAVDTGRSAGFRSVNIDLIYGLPYQTRTGFAATVERVLTMRPERVALFHYAHVPWIRKHQEGLPEEAFPDAALKMAIFTDSVARFTAAGYEYIGLDHFALPEDELAVARKDGTLQRNFMGYTTRKGTDLLPFGVSAIGEVGGAFVANPREISTWAALAGSRGHAVERGHVLDADDRLRRDVIIGLMCRNRVVKSEIAKAHGVDFDRTFASELEELRGPAADGLVILGQDALEITPLGQVFLRNVALPFDRYYRLRRASGDPAARTFSKTV
jgi:oxygen-independent coproporphyrinogen III oxidase